MPTITFSAAHIFFPTGSDGTINVLAMLRNQANYTIVANSPNIWSVQLVTPQQGVVTITFFPPESGGSFTPGTGENPPGGPVGRITFQAANGAVLAQFGMDPLGFTAFQLISDTTLLISSADTFFGSGGADAIRSGPGFDQLFGSGGNDTLIGESGGDTIFGESGDDNLSGDEDGDFLLGQAGNDVIHGGPGDDVIAGGAGNDNLSGEAGVDRLSYASATGAVTVDLATAAPQNTGEGVDSISGFEHLEGSAHADSLAGGDGADVLNGGASDDVLFGRNGDDTMFGEPGADQFIGGPGDDQMFGGDGIDFLTYADAPGAVVVTLATPGVAQDTLGAGIDTLDSIESLEGSRFDDTMIGSGLDESFSGFDGDDLISAGAGADLLQGNNGDDMLAGGDGDDVIEGGAGADSLEGGVGVDLLSYLDASAGVVVDLSQLGAAQDTVGAGVDTLVSPFERLEGTGFGDVLTGSGADEVFFDGGGGDDVIRGEGGNDVIFVGVGDDLAFGGSGDDVILSGGGIAAGNGADQLVGGDGADLFVLDVGPSGVDQVFGGTPGADSGVDRIAFDTGVGVIVQLGPGYATTNDAAHLLIATFSGIEDAVGTAGDDALIGDAADNTLVASVGRDWLVGGGGDDRFVLDVGEGFADQLFGGTQGADSGVDTIDYSPADGPVVVQLNGWATVGVGSTIATFSGIENAIGTSQDDALIGSNANNVLEGAGGSDWLVGGAGDDRFVQGTQGGLDRLFGDAGIDTIDYGAAGLAVTVQLNGWSTTTGGATLATFTGVENAIGSAFNDALIGSSADNRVTGGAGADWLVGGVGNDTFVQDVDTSSIDRLFGGTPGADSGIDAIDYSQANAGVVVQLSGYATTNGGGNITLATFAGIENAVGSNFADALIGNASNNRITGGGGGDWLVGGLGADTFVYRGLGDGAGDSIRDFSQAHTDKIDLSAIDANPLTGLDDAFVFATTRHGGVVGEAVVSNFGGSSLVSLYVDADSIADMTIQVVHQQGLVMNAGDFVL